jgi:esterase/lipase superfamily enzyme
MPSPTLYAEAGADPFKDTTADNVADRATLFYATDREPAGPDDPQAYYANERGHLLRGGVAKVSIAPPLASWDAIRRETLAGDRGARYKLRLSEVQEFGVLPFSLTRYMQDPPSRQDMRTAGHLFAAQIDAQLARSPNKDIFIYAHGYNVDFDYSTLVSKELQHFLGYQGAFISYNWAATPSRLAYFRDQESALSTRRNLRLLIEFLSENTRARRIHLIGYSAGTRLMFEAAYQVALQPAPRPRLGRLILIGSDLDTAFVLQALNDGLLDAVDDVTFYQSETDVALAMSRAIFGRQRIGQASQKGTVPPAIANGLAASDNLHVIDVTDAEAADTGNGHWYFRSSPWASSDLFISLLTNRDPGERGLVRAPGEVVWRFPTNYPDVLKSQYPTGF